MDVAIDVPYPRVPEDNRLIEIEKQVARDFFRMEEAASADRTAERAAV